MEPRPYWRSIVVVYIQRSCCR